MAAVSGPPPLFADTANPVSVPPLIKGQNALFAGCSSEGVFSTSSPQPSCDGGGSGGEAVMAVMLLDGGVHRRCIRAACADDRHREGKCDCKSKGGEKRLVHDIVSFLRRRNLSVTDSVGDPIGAVATIALKFSAVFPACRILFPNRVCR
ncbi:hypothetical protein NKJ10_10065 [Mesorhizobium sp. M0204]|uniref:hypothetical protein n=1 Tax=Mesorhizobium sp. M0204 TaxID=2956913 RepID=UPI00333CB465